LVRTDIFNQRIGKFNGCIVDWKLKARVNLDYFIKLLTLSVSIFSCFGGLAEGLLCNRRNHTKTFTYEFHTFCVIKPALSWLRLLIAGLLLQRVRFDSQPFHAEFVMNEITLGEVLTDYFGFLL
jgi:hypothetical protein